MVDYYFVKGLDSTVRSPRTLHVGTYWSGRTIRHLSLTLLHIGLRRQYRTRSPRTPHVGTYWSGRTIRHLSRTLLHTGLRTCHPIRRISPYTSRLTSWCRLAGISVVITSFLF